MRMINERQFIILIVILLASINISFGQNRDYKILFDTDFLSSNDQNDDKMFFSIRNSHGLASKSVYYGIALGYDRYPDIGLIPIMLSTKYIFYGNGFRIDGLINGFFSFDVGYSVRVSKTDTTTRNGGFIINPGVGVFVGNMRNVKFIFLVNYNLQEFSNGTSSGKLAVRLGALFSPN